MGAFSKLKHKPPYDPKNPYKIPKVEGADNLKKALDGVSEREFANFEPAQYDFNTLPLDAAVGVIGKRRFGKSVWVDHCMSKRWQFYPAGAYCFTKTKHN